MHDLLMEALAWLNDILLYLPITLWGQFVTAILEILDAIFQACTGCNPSIVGGQVVDLFGMLAPGLIWALSMIKIDIGIRVIFCAMLIRFLIRRLPVVG